MTCVHSDRGRGAINFVRGVPPPEAFPTDRLQECAKAVLEGEGSVVLQYYPARGFHETHLWRADYLYLPPFRKMTNEGI